jgi:hypothetical protein
LRKKHGQKEEKSLNFKSLGYDPGLIYIEFYKKCQTFEENMVREEKSLDLKSLGLY